MRKYLIIALLLVAPSLFATISDVRIVEFFGNGGGASAPYKNDYVVLYNHSNDTVDMSGASLRYATSAGQFGASLNTNLAGSIPPYSYYLIQEASGGATGANLPTADVAGSINFSSSNGKIALFSDQSTGTANCPSTNRVDLLGYGTLTVSCVETTASTAGSTTQALLRTDNCTDTNDNSADFALGTNNPRNTASTVNLCGATLTPTPMPSGGAGRMQDKTRTMLPVMTPTPIRSAYLRQ